MNSTNSTRTSVQGSPIMSCWLRPMMALSFLLISAIALAQVEVKVVFTRGFIGTVGTNSNVADNIKTFTTLGVTKAYFIQNNPTALFVQQGNDIPGVVRLVFSNNTSQDISGAINWRGPSGNAIEYFGFIPATNITPFNISLPGGGTYTVDASSNLGLLKNSSTITFADGSSLQGNAAMTGILDELNSYLLQQQVNGGTIAAGQTICSGTAPAALTSSTLASGGIAALTYQWQSSTDNVNFTDIQGAAATGYTPGILSTTTYFRRAATDGDLKGYSNVVTITVNPAATAGTLSGTQTVCAGSTTSFSSTVSGGSWSSNATAVATVNSSSGLITGVAAGTATITYTVPGTSGCADAIATRTVTVAALPATATISATQPTCTVATGSLAVTTPTGAEFSYSLNGGTYQSGTTFSAIAPGNYTITVRNASGCIATAANATINAQPATPATPGSISGSLNPSAGTSQTYSVTAVAGATSYTWTLPSGWSGTSTTNSITVTPSATSGTVSVRANANGCTSGASSITVSVATDTDGDGIPDSQEGTGDADGDGIADYLDIDSDNDGIPDSLEDAGCNGTSPCTPTDSDGDGIPNYLDIDSDNDGIPDALEDAGCSGTVPCTPTDTDGDGIPNYLDTDSDGDGIPDSLEDAGCNGATPCTPTDSDGDGVPNYLDTDADNDGILDSVEDAGCTGAAPCTPTDTDGDGIANYLDLDSDGDGCSDANEAYGSSTAQGTDGNQYYGTGNPPTVNGSGQVSGAAYGTPNANYTTAGALPTITTNPANQLVQVSGNTGFSVAASTASGTLAYQWQISTDGGTTWSNVTNTAPYTGATTATLSITGATGTLQGYRYRVLVSGSNYVCGAATSATGILTVNFPPAAVNDVVSSPEDQVANGNVLTNDTDANANTMTVTQFAIGTQTYTAGQTATITGVGTIVINANGSYTFTPVANYNGTVPSITYTVTDGQGGTATASLNITVTAVNDLPVAANDIATTPEDQAINGNVITNDTDIDANTLSVTQFVIGTQTYTAGQTATIANVGTLVINANGSYTFTPAANYNGAVPAATYTVSDGNGGTATATLTISVTAVNDLPVAVADVATTNEDVAGSGNVLTNDSDVDAGTTLTVTQFLIGSQTYTAGQTATITGIGTIVINANGSYTFTPAVNYNGAVPPITYTVSDGNGGTATATLTITVLSVADPEDITVSSAGVCGSGAVTLVASTTTITNPVFRWYTDAALTNLVFTGASFVTPVLSSTTTYYVTVSGTGVLQNQGGNGKSANAVILPLPVRPEITASGPLTFCKDDSVLLQSPVATTYQWYKNGTIITGATQQSLLVKTDGAYTVVVTNASGCSSAASQPAQVFVPCIKGIYMPTVFTPNRDGSNDNVKPSVPGMKKFIAYRIYNRWGNIVFDNTGTLQAWDGRYKGVDQPADTYIWIVQGEDGQGKAMRGTGQITLIR